MDEADCGPHCRETLEEIERFLDGELDVTLRVRVEHHLSGCNPCTQRAEFRRYLKLMVSEKCAQHEAPAGLSDRIRALIRDLDQSPSP